MFIYNVCIHIIYYALARKIVPRSCGVPFFLKKFFNFRYFMKFFIDNIVNITNVYIMFKA